MGMDAIGGGSTVQQSPVQAPVPAKAPGAPAPPGTQGGGGGISTLPTGSGQAIGGVANLETNPELMAALNQLITVLTSLVAALQQRTGAGMPAAPGLPSATVAPSTAGNLPMAPAAPLTGGGAAMPAPVNPASATPARVAAPAPQPTAAAPTSYSVSTPGGSKWTAKASEINQIKALGNATIKPN